MVEEEEGEGEGGRLERDRGEKQEVYRSEKIGQRKAGREGANVCRVSCLLVQGAKCMSLQWWIGISVSLKHELLAEPQTSVNTSDDPTLANIRN